MVLFWVVSSSFLTILARCISNASRGDSSSLPTFCCGELCDAVRGGGASWMSFSPKQVNPSIAFGGMYVRMRLGSVMVVGSSASGSTCIARASVPRSVHTQRAVLRLSPSISSCSSIVCIFEETSSASKPAYAMRVIFGAMASRACINMLRLFGVGIYPSVSQLILCPENTARKR